MDLGAPAAPSAPAAPGPGTVGVLQVRRIGPASAGKVALLLAVCGWIASLVAGFVLWQLAAVAGILDNSQSFWAEATGQESVSWNGLQFLLMGIIGGGLLVLVVTGLAVLTAVLFNVLAEFTGGLRIETRVPQRRRRR